MTKQKILIVDDEAAIVNPLARLLEMAGFQVIEAYGGADGLQKATTEHPDLVILDVAMRDVDGFEVLSKIKNRKIPTRIIIFTGYANSVRDVVKFIKAGACDYLFKGSSTSSELIDAVKRALAVETTLNLQVSDTTPIVEQLIASAEKLANDNQTLQTQNTALLRQENRASLMMIGIRLLCLLASVGLTALLSVYLPISKTWLFLLPVILFALLVLPLERVKKLYLKTPGTQGELEM